MTGRWQQRCCRPLYPVSRRTAAAKTSRSRVAGHSGKQIQNSTIDKTTSQTTESKLESQNDCPDRVALTHCVWWRQVAYVLLSDLIRHTHREDPDAVILQILRIERCTVKNCNVLIKVTGQLGLVNSFSSEMHSYEHALVDVHVFLAVRHKQNDVIDCVTVVARRREEDIVRLVETSRHVRFLVIIPSIQRHIIS